MNACGFVSATCVSKFWRLLLHRHRLLIPSDADLRTMHDRAMPLSKPVGLNPVEVTTSHLRSHDANKLLECIFPNLYQLCLVRQCRAE